MENKQFRLKRIRSQIRRLIPVLFLIVALVMMVLWRTQNPFVTAVRGQAVSAMLPVMEVLSAPARWIKATKDTLRNMAFLYHRNAELEEENKKLREWRTLAIQLQAEHDEIKKMVKYLPFPKAKVVVARLILDSGDKFSRSYIALAGKQDDIRESVVAMTTKGLFARVIEIGDKACRLMLLTDYLSRVPVLVGKSRIPAILAGDNTNYPKIIFTEGTDKIRVGDIVLTSGYMGLYLTGLNVGLVRSVSENEIEVELFENGEGLEFVQLVDFGLGQNLLKNNCKEP